MRVGRLPSTCVGERNDRRAAGRHENRCRLLPRKRHTRFRGCRRAVTAVAAMAGIAVRGCDEVGSIAAAEAAFRLACCASMFVALWVEMGMAAVFAGLHARAHRHAVAPPPGMAGVQAAAEGEVDHRRDSRDDADKRSHSGCLSRDPRIRCRSHPLVSATLPWELNRAIVRDGFWPHFEASRLRPDLPSHLGSPMPPQVPSSEPSSEGGLSRWLSVWCRCPGSCRADPAGAFRCRTSGSGCSNRPSGS